MSGTADPAAVASRLLRLGLTVAVAESLTGGLLSAALTQSRGSSATFRGGLVVYSTDLKASLADVPQALLASQGPVSADVAAALGSGVRHRLGADIGVGVTGVAGPDHVGDHRPGTVFVGVAAKGLAQVTRVELSGSRAAIRHAAVAAALTALVAAVDSLGDPGMTQGSASVTP